jgi:glycosyltransferase involved in cell wall biosynthesis
MSPEIIPQASEAPAGRASYRVVVSHPSKQGNMYHVPMASQVNGHHVTFLTGFYYKPDRVPFTLTRLLPAPRRQRLEEVLERRRLPGLAPGNVVQVSGPLPEMAYRYLGYRAGNRLHDRLSRAWLRRHIRPGSRGIFHGFQESCELSLGAAGERGLQPVLETTLPPSTYGAVAAECRRLGLPVGETDPPGSFLDELKLARYFIAQSRYSADSLVAFGVDPGRIFQTPLGVDTDQFRPRAPSPDDERPFRALFAGQMSVRKGVHQLIEAWAASKPGPAELVFAGYPSDLYIVDLVRRVPGNFRYLGFVPHVRLQEVYQGADIFVFPSLAEGGVYVIYEALACGLPCVVSSNSGSAVRDGIEGFVVPVGDVEQLAMRIAALRDDAGLRARMSRAARARAENFAWPHFYRRIGLAYDEMVGRNGAAGTGIVDLFDR